MTVSVHVTSGTHVEELSHDAQVLRSVLSRLRSSEGRGLVEELIAGLLADGRLAAQLKPGSRHRVVRVVDVLELEASRRAGGQRIGATIDTLVDAGAEY